MSNNNTLSLVVAAATGAFLYHLYAKISVIENAITQEGSRMISLSSLIDMAAKEEDDEVEVPVGFSNKTGKLRRQNVRVVH